MKKRIFEQTEIFEPIKEIYYPLRVITGFDGGRDISEDLAALSHGGGIINTQIPCLLYISVKTGFDLSESIDNARFSDISRIFSDTARQHKGLAHDLYVYQNVMPSDISIKSMLFYVTGFACSVTNIAASEDTDRQSIYDTFVTILSDYVLNIYNPQLLNPDDIGVLPELHQFGYYMAVALNAKNNGQTLEYVRALRSALACCEGMKPIVEYYIKSI